MLQDWVGLGPLFSISYLVGAVACNRFYWHIIFWSQKIQKPFLCDWHIIFWSQMCNQMLVSSQGSAINRHQYSPPPHPPHPLPERPLFFSSAFEQPYTCLALNMSKSICMYMKICILIFSYNDKYYRRTHVCKVLVKCFFSFFLFLRMYSIYALGWFRSCFYFFTVLPL